jgi:hypothetical protein
MQWQMHRKPPDTEQMQQHQEGGAIGDDRGEKLQLQKIQRREQMAMGRLVVGINGRMAAAMMNSLMMLMQQQKQEKRVWLVWEQVEEVVGVASWLGLRVMVVVRVKEKRMRKVVKMGMVRGKGGGAVLGMLHI